MRITSYASQTVKDKFLRDVYISETLLRSIQKPISLVSEHCGKDRDCPPGYTCPKGRCAAVSEFNGTSFESSRIEPPVKFGTPVLTHWDVHITLLKPVQKFFRTTQPFLSSMRAEATLPGILDMMQLHSQACPSIDCICFVLVVICFLAAPPLGKFSKDIHTVPHISSTPRDSKWTQT